MGKKEMKDDKEFFFIIILWWDYRVEDSLLLTQSLLMYPQTQTHLNEVPSFYLINNIQSSEQYFPSTDVTVSDSQRASFDMRPKLVQWACRQTSPGALSDVRYAR